MGDFFKSALSFISNQSSAVVGGGQNQTSTSHGGQHVGNSSDGGSQESSFIDTVVDLGQGKYKVRKLIAEGGFACVFVVQDVRSGDEFALKRLLASDPDKVKDIRKEINFMKQLSGHPNVVRFYCAGSDKEKEFLILNELCTNGNLIDFIRNHGSKMSVANVLHVASQCCSGLEHMHKQKQPIIHRDIKVENFLLSADGFIKLCDFGSATTNAYDPKSEDDPTFDWSKEQRIRSVIEDEMTRNTTPMYRPPEILDMYKNFPINTSLDVWAMGCVFYVIAFAQHPFEDSSKLRILNLRYTFPDHLPSSDSKTIDQLAPFTRLITACLQVDPRQRATITKLLEGLERLRLHLKIDKLTRPIDFEAIIQGNLRRQPEPHPPVSAGRPAAQPPMPQRPPPPRGTPLAASSSPAINRPPAQPPPTAPVVRGAQLPHSDSFVQRLAKASSSLFAAGAAGQQSTNEGGDRYRYITARLIIFANPKTDAALVSMREILEQRHSGSYAVYNFSQHANMYDRTIFDNRVSEVCLSYASMPPKAPNFAQMTNLAANMLRWLRQDDSNVVVVHSAETVSRSLHCCLAIAALMLACGVDNRPTRIEAVLRRATAADWSSFSAAQRRLLRTVAIVFDRNEADKRWKNSPFTLDYLRVEFSDDLPQKLLSDVASSFRLSVRVTAPCGNKKGSQRHIFSPLATGSPRSIDFPLSQLSCEPTDMSISLMARLGDTQIVPIAYFQCHAGYLPTADKTTFMLTPDDVDFMPDGSGGDVTDANVVSSVGRFVERALDSIIIGTGGISRNALLSDLPPSFAGVDAALLFTNHSELRDFVDSLAAVDEDDEASDDDGVESQPPPAVAPTTTRAAAEQRLIDDGSDDEPTSFATMHQNVRPATTTTTAKAAVDEDDFFSLLDGTREQKEVGAIDGRAAEPPVADFWSKTPAVVSGSLVDTAEDQLFRSSDDNLKGDEDVDVDLLNINRDESNLDAILAAENTNSGPPRSHPAVPEAAPSDPLGIFDSAPLNNSQKQKQQPSVPKVSSTNLIMDDDCNDLQGSKPPGHLNDDLLNDILTSNTPTQQSQPNVTSINVAKTGMEKKSENKPKVKPVSKPSEEMAPKPSGMGAGGGGGIFNFGDLGMPTTGAQSFPRNSSNSSFTQNTNNKPKRTLVEIQNETQLESGLVTEEELRLRAWIGDKRKNIRALLCSLHEILWESALERWPGCGMHQLVRPVDVKRQYFTACRIVHPDKLPATTEDECRQRDFANLVFIELNDAWAEFSASDERAQAAEGL